MRTVTPCDLWPSSRRGVWGRPLSVLSAPALVACASANLEPGASRREGDFGPAESLGDSVGLGQPILFGGQGIRGTFGDPWNRGATRQRSEPWMIQWVKTDPGFDG